MATTRNIRYGISTPETVYNDIKSDAVADYQGALSQDRTPYLPNQSKENDLNVSGRGQEFKTKQLGQYWNRPRFVFSDRVNTELGLLHLRRALGGVDVVTPASGTASKHTIPQVDGTVTQQLPACNVADLLLASDFIHMGCCAGTFVISQQGAAMPVYTVTYIGSGKFRRVREITIANGYLADWGAIALPPTQNYTRGPNVLLEWNDGSLYDLRAAGIVRNTTITIENNLIVDDQRVGDPLNLQEATPEELAAYGYIDVDDSGFIQNHLEFGERTGTYEFQVLMESANLRHWDAMRKDLDLTGIRWNSVGKHVDLGSTDRFSFGIRSAAGNIESTEAANDGDRAVINIRITPSYDVVSKGIFIGEVTNATATPIL